jgi:hypothetical protein
MRFTSLCITTLLALPGFSLGSPFGDVVTTNSLGKRMNHPALIGLCGAAHTLFLLLCDELIVSL